MVNGLISSHSSTIVIVYKYDMRWQHFISEKQLISRHMYTISILTGTLKRKWRERARGRERIKERDREGRKR